MRMRLVLAGWVAVLSGCAPWIGGDCGGPVAFCANLVINDNVIRGTVVGWGPPAARTVSLWPNQPPYMHTPIDLQVDRTVRGATGKVTVWTPQQVSSQGELRSLPIGGEAASMAATMGVWLFARSVDGIVWNGVCDLGVVARDGRVVFPTAEYPSEQAFQAEIDAAAADPKCAMDLPDRLDGQ